MNNIDDGTGKLETRIKLIRKDSLGMFSWDSSASGVHGGWGINDWTQADLKYELNGSYLNTSLNTTINWYNGLNNTRTGIYDYTKGLLQSAQNMIGNVKWYLGGMEDTEVDLIPNTMYTLERGTKVWRSTSGQTCNDGYCPRALFWTGKVALIYPSDYGYATAGGTGANRNACIGTISTYASSSGESWYNNDYSDCRNNDWLKVSSDFYWLLSPRSSNYDTAFYVYSLGSLSTTTTSSNKAVHPAVYLKSEVSISGGNGTLENPYTLSMN